MTELKFNEEQSPIRGIQTNPDTGIIGFLLRKNIAKNKQQANLVMLGLIVVLCVITLFAMNSRGNDVAISPDDPTINLPE